MAIVSHPPWCARTETDGIHRSRLMRTARRDTKLTDVTVHLWRLDEQPRWSAWG